MTGVTIAVAAATIVVLAGVLLLGVPALRTRSLARDAERQVPPAGRFATVRGHRIHYVEAGQGPTILFIHGLGGQLHHFRHTLFGRLSHDFRLIAPDRAGSGYSVRSGGDAGLPEQAATLARLLEEIAADRVLVVGHSLGGAVALALALDHPDKVAGLALIAPLTHLFDRVPPAFAPLYIRSPALRRLLAYTLAAPAAARRAPQTLDFVFGPQTWPADYIVSGGGVLGLRPSHIEATIADMTAIERDLGRYEARYAEITVPVGVLFGSADQVLDPGEHGRPFAEALGDATYVELAGIGHMPQFVAADETEAFIRGVAARAFGKPD